MGPLLVGPGAFGLLECEPRPSFGFKQVGEGLRLDGAIDGGLSTLLGPCEI